MTAVQSLPALNEKKASLNTHVTVMQTVFEAVRARNVPELHALETRLDSATIGQKTFEAVKAMVSDESKNGVDRIRLACVFLLTSATVESSTTRSSVSSAQVSEIEQLLRSTLVQSDIDEYLPALGYVKQLASMSSSSSSSSAFGSRKGIFGEMDRAFTSAQSAIKGVIKGSSSWTPATKALDAVSRGDELPSEFARFDPKLSAEPLKTAGPASGEIRHGVVFVVGGGCYEEFHNLKSYAKQTKRTVVYGCSEMLSPEKLLSQLAEMKR